MSAAHQIPRSYQEAVKLLAEWHAEGDLDDLRIFVVPDPDEREVRFLEVTPDTLPAGEVIAFAFGRAPNFPFRSVIAQVTPDEWRQIEQRNMALPHGWHVEDLRQVWPNGH